MKRVAIGSSTSHDYCFFLPLVGLVWREVIEYEPTFLLVGTPEQWEKDRSGMIVPNALKERGFDVQWIPRIEGVEDATISQSVRLAAAANQDFDDDDLLIPSDADLIPVKKAFYHTHDPSKFPIGLYYANAYTNESKIHLATCHVSMLVRTWRQLFNLCGSGVSNALEQGFKRRGLAEKMEAKKKDPEKWGHVWYEDEFHLTERVTQSQYWPDHIQRINRNGHPPDDRLDRNSAGPYIEGHWPDTYDPKDYTDCHSIRPGWSNEHWPRLRPLFNHLILDRMEWAEDYRIQFRKKMGCAG